MQQIVCITKISIDITANVTYSQLQPACFFCELFVSFVKNVSFLTPSENLIQTV